MVNQKKQTEWLNTASVISCVAVVFMHVNSCFWSFNPDPNSYWFSANAIESLAYFAVPVFFMISGSTLLDYRSRYNTRTYFQKRIRKTVLPYIVWTFIYLTVYTLVLRLINPSDIGFSMIVKALLSGTGIENVFWYFPILFSVYLSIPLFSAIKEDHKKSILIYLAVLGFLLNSLCPFILKIANKNVAWPIGIGVVNGYLLYIVIGYLISKYDMPKKTRIVIYILGFLGLLLHMIGTYKSSMLAGKIIQTYKGYLNVPCILYSVAIFVFFKYSGKIIEKSKVLTNIINILKSYTFSIYLVHKLIINLIIQIFKINIFKISTRLILPFVIIFICWIFIYLIRKLNIGRYLLP